MLLLAEITFDFAAVLPFAAFGAFACAAWALLVLIPSGKTRAIERLQALRNAPKDRNPANDDALRRAADTLSKPLQPKDRLEHRQFKLRLANAGFNSPYAVELYLALKFTCIALGALLGSGGGLAYFGLNYRVIYGPVIGAGIGMYLPGLVLNVLRKIRHDRIFLSLPDALDLLVICIEVGQGLDAAIRKVMKEISIAAPELSAEFNMFNMQIQMGRPRREALHDLGVRAGVDDLNSLAAVLVQADRFGSSIGQSLRALSDSMRVKRRQLAEERAQKTSVQLIFPLVLFIFPGIFVILVGPAAILMMEDLLKL